MKRKVIYVELLSQLRVGHSALVVPLNHTSDLVSNYHPATTSPVQSISQDGKTFTTLNSIYVPLADDVGKKEEERKLEVVK